MKFFGYKMKQRSTDGVQKTGNLGFIAESDRDFVRSGRNDKAAACECFAQRREIKTLFVRLRLRIVFAAALHPFDHLLRLAHAQFLPVDGVDHHLLFLVRQADEDLGMPGGHRAFDQRREGFFGELKQPEGIGNMRAAFMDDRCELFLGQSVEIDQPGPVQRR